MLEPDLQRSKIDLSIGTVNNAHDIVLNDFPSHINVFTRMASRLEKRNRKLVSIMSSHGIKDPWDTLHACRHVNADLAICCASLQMESWGGLNIFGADPGGSALPSPWFNTNVTKQKYLYYRTRVHQGYTVNGVGPTQLTSKNLQDAADRRGGCWIPLHNMTEGFTFLKELLNQAGSTYAGFRDYNGSGPAAERYGRLAVGLVNQWRQRGLP